MDCLLFARWWLSAVRSSSVFVVAKYPGMSWSLFVSGYLRWRLRQLSLCGGDLFGVLFCRSNYGRRAVGRLVYRRAFTDAQRPAHSSAVLPPRAFCFSIITSVDSAY